MVVLLWGDGRRMSTGRRLSANIGDIGAAIGAQLGLKPSSRPSSPGGRRASDASLPGSVPDGALAIRCVRDSATEYHRTPLMS